MLGPEVIIIFIMIALNAVFAAYEMALASISRAQLAVLVSKKRKGAEEAAFMKDRMEASLAVVQLGITLVGAIAAATGGAGFVDRFTPYFMEVFHLSEFTANLLALICVIIPLSSFTIIFAELIPKTFALNNKVAVCLYLSPGMKLLSFIMYPVIIIFETIVKLGLAFSQKRGSFKPKFEDNQGLHELNAAASLARASKLIGAREEKIVLSAAQLSVRPVKEIALPAHDIFMISMDAHLSQALIKAHLDMHTRFPVCRDENNPQTIEGYINFKDIVAALKLNPNDPSIKGIVRPIKRILGNTTISVALEQMMQEKTHIALVVSENKEVIGMLTLEDILEELVGEIEDEFDRLPIHIHPYPGGWIMGGGVLMTQLAQTLGIEWPVKEHEPVLKLAEWCAHRNGGHFQGGEIIDTEKFQILVRKCRRKRVAEAVVMTKDAK